MNKEEVTRGFKEHMEASTRPPEPVVPDLGVTLDRILTIYANEGRLVAMKSLAEAVREDLGAQARGEYAPRTLLWYVVGTEVSGDKSFYKHKDFVVALALSVAEVELYKAAVAAVEKYIAVVAVP